ncbi:trypsin-like peptidase domain-containing protein [Limisalsivibrio acetivorans]|uniref:trypsin-like peptidase domain-containing protein n=1 Tax=Limisalsivibrio acetivorans TaxID=1304888 RepID=UPI0003B4C572|nr:trypsin-like peptidase domain-containing protein [Limisalsivibrio acetivorans]
MFRKNLLFFLIIGIITVFGHNCKADSKTERLAPPEEKLASERATPVVRAVQKVEKSVVNIRTEKTVERRISPFMNDPIFNDPFFEDFFGMRKRKYKTQSLGSGVVVDRKGTIVTNYHVVEAATKIFVIFSDDTNYEAEVIGGDKSLDLAILKIKDADKSFPFAELGTSEDLMLGETIIAMGNPYGLNSSVTTGVISATQRVMKIGDYYAPFIQTDALINPGNSGGPLLNINGDIIGINSAIYREAQGIGFSIPIDTVNRVMPEILEYGRVRRGYPGFTVIDVTRGDDIKLMVEKVDDGSNADKIGLEPGDEIVRIGGVPVSSAEAMGHLLRSYPPGSPLEIAIRRNGEDYRGKILMEERPEDYGLKWLKEKYGIVIREKKGYLTVSQSRDSNYIRNGDILVAVNNNELNSLGDLNRLLTENEGKSFILTVYRGDRLLRVKVNP